MNFTDLNLDQAEVIGKELNHLSFNPDDYPSVNEFVHGVLCGMHNNPVKIPVKELSVNGKVVADRMDKYLSQSKFIPSSALKEVLKNPASYFFYMNDRENFECKPAEHFDLGTFAHSAFLEPERFNKVVVEPEYSLSSNEGVEAGISFWEKLIEGKFKYPGVAEKKINAAVSECDEAGQDMKKLPGKKYYLQCLKDISGFTSIKSKHKIIIDLLKRNYHIYGGGIIPALLRGAQFETSFYGVDPVTGLKVRVRPDAFNTEENIGFNAIISLKTTSAPDMGKFVYDSAKFRYELSEGMYQEVVSNVTGRKFNVTIMIVLQTVAPYLPAVFIWSPEDLANGKYKYRYALDTVKECMDKNLYPGFESLAEEGNYGIIQMQQPSWATKLLHPVDIED